MRRLMKLTFLALLLFAPLLITVASPFVAEEMQSNHAGATTANIITRGPLIEKATNHSATIYWETSEASPTTINYGKNDSLLESTTNSTTDTNHRLTIDSLDIGTKYFYQIESGAAISETYHFFTAPADGEEFRLILAGDNRPDSSEAPDQPEEFSQQVDMIIEEEPHLVILTGDFVYRVTDSHSDNVVTWEKFTNISDRIAHYAPVVGTLGNHDTGSSTETLLLEYFFDALPNFGYDTTYFSFTYAGADFFILDSEQEDFEGRITGTQYEWLENALAESQSPMKMVFAHRPLYPVNHMGSALDVNITERDRLQSLFESENVTLFAAGHDHCYNRIVVNQVTHIITGGLGAPLYSTAWGGAFYHYILSEVSYDLVNYTVIKKSGAIAEQHKIPDSGPIEIFLRGFGNTSRKENGSLPEIYFSEVPVTKYFSWNGNENKTVLTGLPDVEANHTLDVYAEDEEGQWSHVRYVFEAFVRDNSFPPPDGSGDGTLPVSMYLIIGSIVSAAVVAVIVIFILKRRN